MRCPESLDTSNSKDRSYLTGRAIFKGSMLYQSDRLEDKYMDVFSIKYKKMASDG